MARQTSCSVSGQKKTRKRHQDTVKTPGRGVRAGGPGGAGWGGGLGWDGRLGRLGSRLRGRRYQGRVDRWRRWAVERWWRRVVVLRAATGALRLVTYQSGARSSLLKPTGVARGTAGARGRGQASDWSRTGRATTGPYGPAGRARAKPRAKSVMSQAHASPSRAREAALAGQIAAFQHKNDGLY